MEHNISKAAGLSNQIKGGRKKKGKDEPGRNMTDTGLAERFAKRHGGKVRYCHPWHCWLVWDGTRWSNDNTGAVGLLAKETVLSLLAEAAQINDDDKRRNLMREVRQAETAARRAAIVQLARSEPSIPILPDAIDRDPWALNCPNGTLNLKAGSIREHRPTDFITKICPVPFDQNATAPTWLAFLDKIFEQNRELINFLQRLLGYCLTGDVSEQVLPIFHGIGSNGKSTLINVISIMMGMDYSIKAPTGFLVTKKQDAHPTELADLFGKRLIAAVETDEGRRLAEALVKELTGGDRIRARRMHENFWEFSPTHKVVLACNHRPEVRGTDHAIWRRIRLVPFNVVIPDHQQDKRLPEKLKAELPGILAWCVRGCLDWQRDGLGYPPAVESATRSYRADQDVVGAFLLERCVTGSSFRAKASALYESYKEHCGDHAISLQRFGKQLTERGFRRFTSNGSWYDGIGLVT
jgi:putative DNA primase/helicase